MKSSCYSSVGECAISCASVRGCCAIDSLGISRWRTCIELLLYSANLELNSDLSSHLTVVVVLTNQIPDVTVEVGFLALTMPWLLLIMLLAIVVMMLIFSGSWCRVLPVTLAFVRSKPMMICRHRKNGFLV